MDPDRHARLTEVFLAAAELEPPERAEYLDRACGEDLELRREVEELLALDSRAAAVDRPVIDQTLPPGLVGESRRPPKRIGRYRLQEHVNRTVSKIRPPDRFDQRRVCVQRVLT